MMAQPQNDSKWMLSGVKTRVPIEGYFSIVVGSPPTIRDGVLGAAETFFLCKILFQFKVIKMYLVSTGHLSNNSALNFVCWNARAFGEFYFSTKPGS